MIDSVNRPLVAGVIVFSFLLVSISGFVFPALAQWSVQVSQRGFNGEGLIEYIEAACWFLALATYAGLIWKSRSKETSKLRFFWLVLFCALCFMAFGEEVSWGQHLVGFDPPEAVKALNKQNELNLHNLNVSRLIGLEEDHVAYLYLENVTRILNPVFYFVCTVLYLVLPVLRRRGTFSRFSLLAALPLPASGTTTFFGICLVGYVVLDKFFFDVGEIFELSLALVALLTAIDVWIGQREEVPGPTGKLGTKES
jgi:hypothetical protein